jgi:hypothetical protein
MFKRDVTVVFVKKRVGKNDPPEKNANGVRVQREVTVALKKSQ